MSQHDLVIENQSGLGVRQDLAAALQAVATNNSGASEPVVTFPFMPWADTANDLFKLRNAANTGWVDLYKLSTGEPQQVNLAGAIRLQGDLDASLAVLPASPEVGDMWRISVAGVLPDVGSVNASDSIIYSSTGWMHEDHTDAVTSVAGLMGAISAGELFTALGLGTAATKAEGYFGKIGGIVDFQKLLIGGEEIISDTGEIDFSRLVNVPADSVTGVNTTTQTVYTGSGNITSAPHYTLALENAKVKLVKTYTKSNCNCNCNCDCTG